METTTGLLLAVAWFLVRFGLPVLVTLFVCWVLKKIDTRWQSEGQAYRDQIGAANILPAIRCWVFNDCPKEKREGCKAYQDQDIPCWQHFRNKNGYLKEECIDCGVFRGIPVPVTGD
jgi:hypothetical protein